MATSHEKAWEVASKYEGSIQKAVIDLLESTNGATLKQVEALVVAGDFQGLFALLTIQAADPKVAQALSALMQAYDSAGQWAKAEAAQARGKTPPIGPYTGTLVGTIDMAIPARFNPVNPATLQAIRTWQGNLIQQMDAQRRAVITDEIARGLLEGLNPRATARNIRDGLPLTRTQNRAVMNYRAAIDDIAANGMRSAQGWGLYTPDDIARLKTTNPELYKNLNFTAKEIKGGRRWAKISRAAGTGPIDPATGIKGTKPLGFVNDPRTQGGTNTYRIDQKTGKVIDGMTEWRLRDKRLDPQVYDVLDKQQRVYKFRPGTPERKKAEAELKAAQAKLKSYADRMETRYRERMVKHRSEVIARTESMRAANLGMQDGFRQAIDEGIIRPNDMVRTWITAADDRVRVNHRAAGQAAQNKKIPLTQPFVVGGVQVSTPPHEPNCRCAVKYEINI